MISDNNNSQKNVQALLLILTEDKIGHFFTHSCCGCLLMDFGTLMEEDKPKKQPEWKNVGHALSNCDLRDDNVCQAQSSCSPMGHCLEVRRICLENVYQNECMCNGVLWNTINWLRGEAKRSWLEAGGRHGGKEEVRGWGEPQDRLQVPYLLHK